MDFSDIKNLSDADLTALFKKCEEEKKNRMARLKDEKWNRLCFAWADYVAHCGAIRDIERREVKLRSDIIGEIIIDNY